MKTMIVALAVLGSVPAFARERLKDVVIRDGVAGVKAELTVASKNFNKKFIGLDNPAIQIEGQPPILIASEGSSAANICAMLDSSKGIATMPYPADVTEMKSWGFAQGKIAELKIENGHMIAEIRPAMTSDYAATTLECADHALPDGD